MADHGTVQADESQEVLGLAVVAAVQAAAAVQQGHGALDHPAVAAQAVGVVLAAAGDAGHGLPSPQLAGLPK